jgi:hypothetical protein
MPVHNKLQARSAVLGGVIAGAAAGVALLPYSAITTLIRGQDLMLALKFPSTWLLGERAMLPGFDFAALYVGLGTHFAVSIGWGVAFALLFYGINRPLTAFAGLAWGIVVWLAMFYVVLPLVGLGDAARSMPVVLAMVEHLLYGAVVGLVFLPFQRELPRGALRGDEAHPA